MTVSSISQLPMSLPSGHMNKVAMVAEMKVMHGLSNMDSSRLIRLWPLMNAQSASSTDHHWFSIWHHFQGWSSNYLETGWLYQIASIMEGQRFLPTEIDIDSGYGFAFPACNVSAKATRHGLIKWLSHHHGIPNSIASNQRTHFIANEVQQWAHDCGIHWFYHVPHFSEIAGSLE